MTRKVRKVITASELHQMIATAAYYLAENRGFAPGGEEQDWLLAEKEILKKLAD